MKSQTTELLAVILEDEEIAEMGRIAAKAIFDKAQSELEFDEVRKAHKERIARFDKIIFEKSKSISRGTEYREVDCEWDHNFKDGVKVLTRLDTGEVVKELKIDPEERQLDLSRNGDDEDDLPGPLDSAE